MAKYTNLTVKVPTDDFTILEKWGFHFEKNIQVYLQGIADELRRCEAERENTPKIKRVSAVYTGGGIWLFYGDLMDGNYFLTDDNGYTIILNESASDLDTSLYAEWQEAHTVQMLEGDQNRFFGADLLDRLENPQKGDELGGITDTEIWYYTDAWEV